MKYFDVQFITSAIDKSGWPNTDVSEFCLAGRSNVGKSSFINTLFNRKNLAYVGKTPGKTQLLNFFYVNQLLTIVDVPGYGYAARSQRRLVDFGNMMEEYFNERKQLKILFLIVDLRHKPTQDDIAMLEYAQDKHLKTIVIATKYDKCKNSEIAKNIKLIGNTLKISPNKIIPFSSVTRYGLDEVWNIINAEL